jgi:hypothetical protein
MGLKVKKPALPQPLSHGNIPAANIGFLSPKIGGTPPQIWGWAAGKFQQIFVLSMNGGSRNREPV